MRHLTIALFSLLTVAAGSAGAAEKTNGPATEAIRSANTKLRELLGSKGSQEKVAARITTELRGLFDIGDLAKRALVDHWTQLSPAQRTELVDTLRLIVERNYISQLRNNLDYEIVYSSEAPQGEDVLVKTVIKAKRGGRPVEIPVDYILHREGGTWKAYDVITDDVSLLKNYRSQFNKIIGKEGPQGLLRRMKARLEKNDD